MFRIYPAEDPELQKKCALLCGAEPEGAPFVHIMEDCDTGAVMGFSRLDIVNDTGILTDLRERTGTHDGEAMFILGRTALNFLDLCGVHRCTASDAAGDGALLHAIGFREEADGSLSCDLTGMFNGKCGGKTIILSP